MSVRKTLESVNKLTKRNVPNVKEELKEKQESPSILGNIRSHSSNSITSVCSEKLYTYPDGRSNENIQLQIHCSLIECGAVTITKSPLDPNMVVITFQIPQKDVENNANPKMAKYYPPVGNIKYSNNFTKTFYDEYNLFINVKCYNFQPIQMLAVGGGGAGGTQLMKSNVWIGRGAGGGGAGILGVYTPTGNQAMSGTLQIQPGVGGYAATESWETATNGKPTIITWIDEQNSAYTWRFNGGGYGAGEQSPEVYPQYTKLNEDTGNYEPIYSGAGANGGSGGGSTVAPNTGIYDEKNTNGPPGDAWWFQHEDQISNAIYPNESETSYAYPPNMGPYDGFFQYYFSPGGQVDDPRRTWAMYTTSHNQQEFNTDASAGGGGGGAGSYPWPANKDAYNYKGQLQGTNTAKDNPSYGVGGLAIAGVGGTGGTGYHYSYNQVIYAEGGSGGDGLMPYDDRPPNQAPPKGYAWDLVNNGANWIGRDFPKDNTGSGGFGGNCSVRPGAYMEWTNPAGYLNWGMIGSNGANGSVVIIMQCENLEIVSSLENTCNLTEKQNPCNTP